MIPGKHRCPEMTRIVGEVVKCRKDASHDGNHWALKADGLDVVWTVTVLRPPAKKKA